MVTAQQPGMSRCTTAVIETDKNTVTWIEDQTQKRIPLSTMTITPKQKKKQKNHIVMLKEKAALDTEIEFTASSERFK